MMFFKRKRTKGIPLDLPVGTPVQVRDTDSQQWTDVYFVEYRPDLNKDRPFFVTGQRYKPMSGEFWRYCRRKE